MADSSARSVCWGTVALFSSLTLLTFIGVPLFAYFYDYSLLDWLLLGILYVVTGMGITIGYHRMMTHRSSRAVPGSKLVCWCWVAGLCRIPRSSGAPITSVIMRIPMKRLTRITPEKDSGTATWAGCS